MNQRGSGILLHITSLPSPYGIGDMGPGAFSFIDFLAEAKQRFWQILPLNPTQPVNSNSPYQSTSTFAGSPILISPDILAKENLVSQSELEPIPTFSAERVNYPAVHSYKEKLLDIAYESFRGKKRGSKYEKFCQEHSYWLDDFALFMALKAQFQGKTWNEWPPDLRDRQPRAIQKAQQELSRQIDREKFFQYLFFTQWAALKDYGRGKGISFIGDMPIYVNYDSPDVWVHSDIFKLDADKKPLAVAGVPPDYFSETGQLWGNPVYRWDTLKKHGYSWWIHRLGHNLKLFDWVRIDHFRGFVAYWEIPAGEKTAVGGKWVEAPAKDFFQLLQRNFPANSGIIAEDLGVITPDVTEVIDQLGFPGMKVLLFAFGPGIASNPYIPHNLIRNCVAYTGTHDNNTIRGWFEKEATDEDKQRLFQYLGRNVPGEELHWELVRLVMMSVANISIFPMQDILGLGEQARMNQPSTTEKNWEWRLQTEQLKPEIIGKLKEMTEIYGRSQEKE